MTPVTLNAYQSEQLRAFMSQHEDDERVAADFGERADPVCHLEWFACDVPGMVVVKNEDGFGMRFLYPAPRPVPRDPLFQHAGDISDHRPLLMKIYMRRDYLRDWQIAGTLDAPDVMPAGGCEYFAADDEAYGALQMTCERAAPLVQAAACR